MTYRRRSTPRADHTAGLSEAVGTIYPNLKEGPMADPDVVLRKLREPAIQAILCDVAGVLNAGELFDDAAPTDQPAILPPYGPADETAGRDTLLGKAGVALQVEGPCQMSVSVADGIRVWLGWADRPGLYIEGQAMPGNGAGLVTLPAGTWWVSARLDPASPAESTPANLWRGKA